MIRSTFGVATALCIALVTACGDDEAPADKYPTSDSFCTAKAASECDAVAAACSVSDDACRTARKSACNTAAGAATAQGRAYRPASAQECIDKVTALYADRVLDPAKTEAFEDACERVFTGDKKKSDACDNAYACEGTLFCDVDKGFCADKVTKKLNDPCNNPGDTCEKGLFCQDKGGGSRFCTAKGTLGVTCQVPAMPCAEDLYCNGTACVARQAAGATCTTGDECVTGYCNPSHQCQAPQYASETGTCKDFGQAGGL